MKQNLGFLFAIFLCARALCLALPPRDSDVQWAYAPLGLEALAAHEQSGTIYEVRRAKFEAWQAEQRAHGLPQEGLERRYIEYPPVALLPVQLPAEVIGLPSPGAEPAQFVRSYHRLFRTEMAVCELVLFAILIGLVTRTYPTENPALQRERLVIYLGATVILSHFLYDRLDVLVGGLSLAALALLCSRRHYVWSFAVLAVAINFKLVPAVLAPVFLLGSLPAASMARFTLRTVGQLAVRGALLAGLTVGCFLPFYVAGGPDTLGFFAYHQDRGVQMESTYGSIQLALHEFGSPVEIYHSHGSENVRSVTSEFFTKVAPIVMVVTHALAAIVCFVLLRRASKSNAEPLASTATLAERHPQLILGSALLVFLAFVLSNKVFSPQYMLWIVALVPLVPLPLAARRYAGITFLLACAITTILVPFLYASDLVVYTPEGERLPPTPRAILLLGLRNLLMVGLTIGIAIGLLKHSRERAAEPT